MILYHSLYQVVLHENFESMMQLAQDYSWVFERAVALDVPEDVLIDRILARARNEIDRDREQILKRFFDYNSCTVPVLDRLEEQGMLTKVETTAPDIETNIARVKAAMGLDSLPEGPKQHLSP